MVEGVWRDLRYAAGSLAGARAFTLVCVLSLGIGMVPVIAIPYWARILKMPPPNVSTETLVELVTTANGAHAASEVWSYPDFETLRQSNTGMTLIGWKSAESTIALGQAADARTRSVATMFVSANYFTTLGVPLARGTAFDATGDNPLTAEPVVIVGYRYWQKQMSADPHILGRGLMVDGIAHVVVGVAPEHFSGHMGYQERQLFLPLGRYPPLRDTPLRSDRATEWLSLHGRLSPGVSVAQASAAVAAVTSGLAIEYPATNQLKAGIVVPYDPLGYRNEFGIVQTLFQTLTGAVLVVVCLNVSGMMLVRSAMRERDLSIRHAIGASRGRLVRYLLSEAVVLAGLSAVLASIVLFNLPRLWAWWADYPLPFEVENALQFDPFLVAICGGLCLVTSVVFGLPPAIRFSRPVIISSLKDDAGVGGFRAGRVHRWAAALQVAIAVPLIVLCALALDRVRVTATGDLGFASDLLYAAPLKFDKAADGNVEFRIRSARANLAQASGVASVTVAESLPLDGTGSSARISLQQNATVAPTLVTAHVTRVGDDYLDTMGVPLLRGRGFTVADRAGTDMVTVISKALADKLFPSVDQQEAIGQRLTFGAEEATLQSLTIVGVTGDFPTSQMDSAREHMLLPLAQHPSPNLFLVARSAPGESPAKLTAALESAIHALDPNVDHRFSQLRGQPHAEVVTGVGLRQRSVEHFLTRSAIVGGAGSVILVLAALGIYGVVGLMVATRTREIAVRVAMGASGRRVMGMILVDVVKLVTPGVAVGLLLAVAAGRLPVNAGIKLSDAEPLAYAAGATIVVLVAVLTSVTHARRAASVDPMVALRSI